MPSNKYPTYVRMEKEMHDKLIKIAGKENRSLNSLIVHILAKWIIEYDKNEGDSTGKKAF